MKQDEPISQGRAWGDMLRIPQVRRVGGMALGTAVGQAAILLASPILTRIFSPTEFGAYAYYYAALGVLAPVAALRYELAIPIPDSDVDAWQISGVALATSAIISVLLLLVLAAPASQSFLVSGERDLRLLAVVLPLGVLASGSLQTLTYWAVRCQRFGAVAGSRALLGSGTGVTQILFGVLRAGILGLYAGDLAGRALAALLLVRSTLMSVPSSATLSFAAMLRMARMYRGFALMSSPSALINAGALFLPVLAVGKIYGTAAAGLMFVAQRIIGFPTVLLSTASSQVYVSEFARVGSAERIRLYQHTLRRLAIMGGAPLLVAAVAAPALFPAVFGDDWSTAGRLAAVLAPFYFFQLLSGATVVTLDIMQRHTVRLIREMVLLAVLAGVFAAGHLLEMNLFSLTLMYSLVGAALYASSIVLVHRILVTSA